MHEEATNVNPKFDVWAFLWWENTMQPWLGAVSGGRLRYFNSQQVKGAVLVFLNSRSLQKPTQHPGLGPCLDPLLLVRNPFQWRNLELPATMRGLASEALPEGPCDSSTDDGRQSRQKSQAASFTKPRLE